MLVADHAQDGDHDEAITSEVNQWFARPEDNVVAWMPTLKNYLTDERLAELVSRTSVVASEQ